MFSGSDLRYDFWWLSRRNSAMRPVNLVGDRYGRLMVTSEANPAIEPSGRSRRRWVCQCDCGTIVTIRGTDLRSGRTGSCGCFRNDQVAGALTTHGESKKGLRSPEYVTWASMIARCEDENNEAYHHYGGRGISVCPRWRDNYEAFLSDMGRRPSSAHSIDRIKVNGNYEPGNCRWATTKEQACNKRDTIRVTYHGRQMSLVEACERAGFRHRIVLQRIRKYGWSAERALTQPLKKRTVSK